MKRLMVTLDDELSVPDVKVTVQCQLNKYLTEIFSQIEVAGGRFDNLVDGLGRLPF
jgi:hypothetical protein